MPGGWTFFLYIIIYFIIIFFILIKGSDASWKKNPHFQVVLFHVL